MIFRESLNSPFGKIVIEAHAGFVTRLGFNVSGVLHLGGMQKSALTTAASQQLSEYFSGKRREFDLPLRAEGTDCQQLIWSVVSGTGYGDKISYVELAKLAGMPTGARAVGSAVGKNPLPIIIPCHRVIRADGKIGGYAFGEVMKSKLLKLEAKNPTHECE